MRRTTVEPAATTGVPMEQREGWIYLSRELVADILDLAEAEIGAARTEVWAALRKSFLGLALVGASLALLFWVLAMTAYTLVVVVAIWLPPWAAALVVTGFFLVLALVVGFFGVRRFKKVENPINIVLRRLRNHIAWWRTQVSMHESGWSVRDEDLEPEDDV